MTQYRELLKKQELSKVPQNPKQTLRFSSHQINAFTMRDQIRVVPKEGDGEPLLDRCPEIEGAFAWRLLWWGCLTCEEAPAVAERAGIIECGGKEAAPAAACSKDRQILLSVAENRLLEPRRKGRVGEKERRRKGWKRRKEEKEIKQADTEKEPAPGSNTRWGGRRGSQKAEKRF